MINNILQQLLLQIRPILSNELIGMYIGGSVATNNFNSKSSDIDCYVITTGSLAKNKIQQLEEMHKQFYLSKLTYAKKVEVSYISKPTLLNFNPHDTRPYFNEGSFYLAHYRNNFIIELYVLREKGIPICGPNIKQLVKEITVKDLRLAMQKNLNEYWEPMLNNLAKLRRNDYQVFAILTMCRTLYTLETGMITSKIEAARWTISNNDNSAWKDLIEEALCWTQHHSFNRLEETQQFIKYVLDKKWEPRE
ncbi:aminoglycoside adenylyltransferase domain-containing protein [Legionella sp. CNM-1927-20]|uniref:aminoglycoside adenylyltransferase domain-containing protein n=1 Tax=Legionella sp. CNM-1927-20 TaxID=3422221 RepID=UPI00403AAB3D